MREVGCKEVRFRLAHRFCAKYPLDELCRLLGVSRSGYYKWRKRQNELDKDLPVAQLIEQCHAKTHRTYGYRRIKQWLLRETGLIINHKAVLRIMRKYSSQPMLKRKRFRHYVCATYHHYENLLNRNFKAAPQRKMGNRHFIHSNEARVCLSLDY